MLYPRTEFGYGETMARAFHTVVFKDQLNGNVPVHSSPELSETLGRADQLSFTTHVVNGGGGTAPKITVEVLGSNDGVNWALIGTAVDRSITGNGPQTWADDTGSMVLSAWLQLSIKLANADNAAFATVSVCGRSN